jgi:cephalosporin hydroxylase
MASRLRSAIAHLMGNDSSADLLARWNDYPFGREPRAGEDVYRSIYADARAVDYPEIAALETELGHAVDRDWLDDLALHTQVVVKDSRINYQHGRLLYAVLRRYLEKIPTSETVTILETGTARGFSAICMARALADSGRPGTVSSLDVLPHNVPMYWNCIDDRDGPKTRHELLAPWREYEDRVTFIQGDTAEILRRISLNRVHFAYLDARHTREAVMEEAAFVRHRQGAGDIVCFDDVTPELFPGVVEAVDELEAGASYAMRRITTNEQRGYAIGSKLA